MLAVWRLVAVTIFFTQTHHPGRSSCLPECQCSSEMLDCSHNDFTNMPYNKHLTSNLYTALNMSFNRIQILEDNAFIKRGYADLETLDLSYNDISAISPYAFKGLEAMKELILEHNKLLVLQQEVFEPLINLRDLYLQSNKLITVLPQTVSPLKKLINLDLRYNQLTRIAEGTFTNLSVLEKLRLIGNVMKTFAPEIFNPLKNLQYLELQLFESPHEQEVLPPSKPEVTSCLCKRKTALDWCHERRVNCLVTCCHPQEGQYDTDSNVCLSLLNAFSETETAKSRTDPRRDLLWAVAITVGVIILLFITIIIFALLFLKSKVHSGNENCSVVSNFETFAHHTSAAEDEVNNSDFGNEKEINMHCPQDRHLESEK
jgi:hypothetical protein